MSNRTDELLPPEVAIVQELQGLQEQLMGELVESKLSEAFNLADRLSSPVPDFDIIVNDKSPETATDCGATRFASSRLQRRIINEAANEAGIKLVEADSVTGENDIVSWQDNPRTGQQTLRYSDSTGMFRNALQQAKQRYDQPFDAIKNKFRDGALEATTQNDFSLSSEDLDIVMLFMGASITEQNPTKARAKFLSFLYQLPVCLPGDERTVTDAANGVYFDEAGSLIKILYEPSAKGVAVGMYFEPASRQDPSETAFKLGVEIKPERYAFYREQWGEGESGVAPFVTSDTARAVTGAVGAMGLHISDRLHDVILGEGRNGQFDSRFGNSYAELTREIAKVVNNPAREGSQLFADDSDAVKQAFQRLDTGALGTESAKVALDILRQTLLHDPRESRISDVPVNLKSRGIKIGSCKDSEFYFISDIKENNYRVEQVGDGIPMLRKKTGARTTINLSPLRYNGVLLPAGCLFQINSLKDGPEAYTFVRVTAFAFDETTSEDAFGWQYSQARDMAGIGPSENQLPHVASAT